MSGQLELALERRCSTCGSLRHDGCGYDPEMVRPAMSVAGALSATIAHAVEQHGFNGAMERIPGYMRWGSTEHRQAVESRVTELVGAGMPAREIIRLDLMSLPPCIAGTYKTEAG